MDALPHLPDVSSKAFAASFKDMEPNPHPIPWGKEYVIIQEQPILMKKPQQMRTNPTPHSQASAEEMKTYGSS